MGKRRGARKRRGRGGSPRDEGRADGIDGGGSERRGRGGGEGRAAWGEGENTCVMGEEMSRGMVVGADGWAPPGAAAAGQLPSAHTRGGSGGVEGRRGG
jgi:hypothetical protein